MAQQSWTEWFIAKYLQQKGLSASEANQLASQPWVQKIAADKQAGRPTPPGMANLSAKDLPAYRNRAKQAGVSIGDIFQSDFLGKPFKGEAGFDANRGVSSVASAAASLPASTQVAQASNPIAQAAQQPPASPGGLHPAKSGPIEGPTDFGWLFNNPKPNLAVSQADIKKAAKVVYGEGVNEGPDGWKGIASSLRNRALAAGTSISAEAKPSQYEALTGSGKGRIANAPAEKLAEIEAAITPILTGAEPDPVDGATHYLNPAAQGALGRKQPKWTQAQYSDKVGRVGNHVFYKNVAPYQNVPTGVKLAKTPDEMVTGGEGMDGTIRSATFGQPSAPVAMPSVTASGEAWGMDSPSFWKAPAYAQANFNPGIRASGSTGAMAGNAFGATANVNAKPSIPFRAPPVPNLPTTGFAGMSSQMPSAVGFATPSPMSVTGQTGGAMPPPGTTANARPQVPPMLAPLLGRSPLPSPQIASPIPPKPPQSIGGFSTLQAPNAPFAPSGGLGTNPVTMAAAGMSAANPITQMGTPMSRGRTSAAISSAAGATPTPSMVQQIQAKGISNAANVLTANLSALMSAQERTRSPAVGGIAGLRLQNAARRPTTYAPMPIKRPTPILPSPFYKQY